MTSRLGKGVSAAALLAALGVAGCGGGSSDDNTSLFVGSWQYSSGTETVTCQGQPPVTNQLSGTVTVSKGVASPLVIVGPSCTLKITPNGTSATLDPGQTCPPTSGVTNDGTPYTETDTYQSGSFTVNGITGTVAESGTALLVGGGQSITCSFTENGTLNKVSK